MGVPKPLREQLWLRVCGEIFKRKCSVTWCTNMMTPFKFEAGHIIPESKGGGTHIENLLPICAECNKSMGNRYTIHEFSKKFEPKNMFDGFRFKQTVSEHQKFSDNGLQKKRHQDSKDREFQTQADIQTDFQNPCHCSQLQTCLWKDPYE